MNTIPCFYHPKRKAAHKWVDGQGRTFEVCGKCFTQIKEDVATKNVQINAVVVEMTKSEFEALNARATSEQKSLPEYLLWLGTEVENEMAIARELKAIHEVDLSIELPAGTRLPALTDEELETVIAMPTMPAEPHRFPRSKHSW